MAKGIKLWGPKTGQEHTFATKKAAEVFKRKGWTASKPKTQTAEKKEQG